jgi:hypothetical protein
VDGGATANGHVANFSDGSAGATTGGHDQRRKKQARGVARNNEPASSLNTITGKRGGASNYGGMEEHKVNKKVRGECKNGESGGLSQAAAAEQPFRQQ